MSSNHIQILNFNKVMKDKSDPQMLGKESLEVD